MKFNLEQKIKKILRTGLVIGSCLLGSLAYSNRAEAVEIVEQQITSGPPIDQYKPDIYGDRIVYSEEHERGWGVYVYDLSSKDSVYIGEGRRRGARISNNIVVYDDTGKGYTVTIKVLSEKGVSNSDWEDGEMSSVNENKIILADSNYIKIYDLNTSKKVVLGGPRNKLFPQISGDKVIYQEERDGEYDIYVYDLTNDKKKYLFTPKGKFYFGYSIYNNKIVYTDYKNGNADIYMYDINTEKEIPICTNQAEQGFPRIWFNKIVWQDNRNGNWDIYMYDLSTDQEIQVTSDSTDQKYPSIHQDRIVWEDHRNGNADIYMADIVEK